jgi:hypothetical protein
MHASSNLVGGAIVWYAYHMIKECNTCEHDFNAKRRSQKYCCKDCQTIGQRSSEKRVCIRPECLAEFEVKPSDPKKYCSSSCAAKVTNTTSPKRGVEGTCFICDASIPSSRKYCADHRLVAKVLTPEEQEVRRIEYNSYMRDRYRSVYPERKAKALELLGGSCVHCGTTSDLDFDHVDPSTKVIEVTDLLDTHSWASILKEMEKCQLLCKSCHVQKTREDRNSI